MSSLHHPEGTYLKLHLALLYRQVALVLVASHQTNLLAYLHQRSTALANDLLGSLLADRVQPGNINNHH